MAMGFDHKDLSSRQLYVEDLLVAVVEAITQSEAGMVEKKWRNLVRGLSQE